MTPAIMVVSADSTEILLAVEAKLRVSPERLTATAEGMASYMVGYNCPVGLLVSADAVWLYRNRFVARNSTSVELVGKYTNDLIEFKLFATHDWRTEADFELTVHSWLEDLAASHEVHTRSSELRDAIITHVLPALEVGYIQASGPREYLKRA